MTRRDSHHRQSFRTPIVIVSLSLLLVATALICLAIGGVNVPLADVLQTLLGKYQESTHLIIIQFRLPRIVAAILIGAALGVSGSLLQGVVRNPLASPDLLGITGGASVAAVAFMTLFTGYSIHYVPFIAVSGALLVALLVYVLAWRKGVSPFRLVLIGIGLSTAMTALTTFLLISGPAYLTAQVLNWLTGSIYGIGWDYVRTLWPWIVIWLPLSMLLARELDVQAFGDSAAIGLGSRLQRSRMAAVVISVALAGAAVGVAGMISFIGLLAPHIARKLTGHSYKKVIPVSALVGAIILLLADLAGRMLFYPLDIPAGVFTAGIGAPFFLYLLLARKRAR
ncbi:iron ABC transporter permease [Paenibacillaceae bacterium]|nr:iron ABC transporter permease [Paenibacillaceae bacterium]